MASKRKGGKLITLSGILAGAAIGAAVALTYSPGDGDENRKRLTSWTQNRTSDATTWVEHRAGDAGTWTQHRATDAGTWAQHRTTEAGTWAQHRVDDARAGVESKLPGGEQKGPEESPATA